MTSSDHLTNLSLMSNLATLFVKEPGKSVTFEAPLEPGALKIRPKLTAGTELVPRYLKTNKETLELSSGKERVCQIEDEASVRRINYALDKGYKMKFYLVSFGQETATVIARCDHAIFSSKNLGTRPYSKHEELLLEDSTSLSSASSISDDESESGEENGEFSN